MDSIDPKFLHFLAMCVGYISVINLLLPPVEKFRNFPRFQEYYELLVELTNWFSLNLRGRIATYYIKRLNGGNDK
jgi:hypothetical protein